MVFSDDQVPGAGASASGNVSLLRPAEQFFDEMVTGWSAQQTSRMLAVQTIQTRASQVRRFADFCGTPPWQWSPADVEEWTTQLVSGSRPLSVSTVRAYQNSIALFCDYLIDHRYGWVDRCLELFDSHPVQVCHEWNTVIHVSDHEARHGGPTGSRRKSRARSAGIQDDSQPRSYAPARRCAAYPP